MIIGILLGVPNTEQKKGTHERICRAWRPRGYVPRRSAKRSWKRGNPQQLQGHLRAALAELRQWVATTTATTAVETDGNDVQRQRKDTLDG